jgi:hypothetical protein
MKKERTTKCRPITSEMSWREVLVESRKLNDDYDEIMSLPVGERVLISCAMFSEFRHQIIESLPKDLSEKEFKKQLYFRTYGEHLPEDFFDRRDSREK